MKEYKMDMWCGYTSLRAVSKEAIKILKSIADTHYDEKVEVIVRIRDHRAEWIERFYTAAMHDVNQHLCTLSFCKDVTIMHNFSGVLVTAAPRHGDKYDRKTGIAVCYAKLCGKDIPEFI